MADTDLSLRVTASTGQRVRRDGWRPDGHPGPWLEALDVAGADLARANAGAVPLTLDHVPRSDLQVGVVEGATVEGGRIIAKVRFSKEPAAQRYYRDVVDGVRRNVSVGYRVDQWRDDSKKGDSAPTFTATKWELIELSLVTAGADSLAGFRSTTEAQTIRTRAMTVATSPAAPEVAPPVIPPTPPATPDPIEIERERSAGILLTARRLGVDLAMASRLIADGTSLAEARNTLFEANHEAARATAVNSAVHVSAGIDHADPSTVATAIADAWAHRANASVQLSDRARQYRGMRCAEAISHLLRAANIRPGTSERETIKRAAAHTTSDFAGLTASALNKAMLPAYNAARTGLIELAYRDSARDFKSNSRLRVGEFPSLLHVQEHGEYTYGSIGETKEAFVLKKYGRIFAITWEALINDDLQALTAASRSGALAAANLEADLLAERVNSNPAMSDGVVVFHAVHNNVGTPGAISATTVGQMMGLMRNQKGVDGATILNITPAYLAVPSALETVAKQLVATIAPAQVADDNSAFRNLTVIVDPRLDVGDPNGWYLFAGPSVPSLSIAFLEGEEGPTTESRNGFEIDAVEIKVRHVAAAYWADHRGAAMNVGA